MKFEDFKNEGSEAAVKVFETISILDSTWHGFYLLHYFYFVVRPPESTDSKDVIT